MGNGVLVIDAPRNPNALVNELGYGLTDETSDLLCSLIVPSFLKLLFNNCRCSSDTLTADAFETKESFCERFRNEWSLDTQKCLNHAAIVILGEVNGIINFKLEIGRCCAQCPPVSHLQDSSLLREHNEPKKNMCIVKQ